MAQKQRGKTTSASKTADPEKNAENINLVLESSDDETPEEVTFEDSKAAALRSMKQALDTARREKELLKEKRRKRQELFQEQKVCDCVLVPQMTSKGLFVIKRIIKLRIKH
ncbi:nucleolar protein 7-like, partial [Plectropomus leopardus]|uniref:nucleolar protein 7-like n=1 Tax=Plectropomus leopardus TaxID=160734 RepID=UPI001C4BFC16